MTQVRVRGRLANLSQAHYLPDRFEGGMAGAASLFACSFAYVRMVEFPLLARPCAALGH